MTSAPLNVPGATALPVEDWQELMRDMADQVDAHFDAGDTPMVSAQDLRAFAAHLPTLLAEAPSEMSRSEELRCFPWRLGEN